MLGETARAAECSHGGGDTRKERWVQVRVAVRERLFRSCPLRVWGGEEDHLTVIWPRPWRDWPAANVTGQAWAARDAWNCAVGVPGHAGALPAAQSVLVSPEQELFAGAISAGEPGW